MKNQVQSTKWHLAINLLIAPGIGLFQYLSYISFDLNFEHSSPSFIQAAFAEGQFEFVVFVSCIVLPYLYCDLLSVLQNVFALFTILPVGWMLEIFCH